jgi:DNA-binding NarL/FixJ family response regulator
MLTSAERCPLGDARNEVHQAPDNKTLRDIDPDAVQVDDCNNDDTDSRRAKMVSSPAFQVGLVDPLRLSRDCLITAFRALCPELTIVPLPPVAECDGSENLDLDTILFHSHEEGPLGPFVLQQVAKLNAAFKGTPIILISNSRSTLRLAEIRAALRSGASAVVPALTSELGVIQAALQIVHTGGIFAPADILLGSLSKAAADSRALRSANRLTARELNVLAHLRHGNANKIIASELGMAESTVKVHLHNIMRKLGASNRTQAAFKAEEELGRFGVGGVYEAPPDEAA